MTLQRNSNGRILKKDNGRLMRECCCETEDCCQWVQRYILLCIMGCSGTAAAQGKTDASGAVKDCPRGIQTEPDNNAQEWEDWVNTDGHNVCDRVQNAGTGYVCISRYPQIDNPIAGAGVMDLFRGYTEGEIILGNPNNEAGAPFEVWRCVDTYTDPAPGIPYTFGQFGAGGGADVEPNFKKVDFWEFLPFDKDTRHQGISDKFSSENVLVKGIDASGNPTQVPRLLVDINGDPVCEQSEGTLIHIPNDADQDGNLVDPGIEAVCFTLHYDYYGPQRLNVDCGTEPPAGAFPDTIPAEQLPTGDPCSPCICSGSRPLGPTDCSKGARPFLKCGYTVNVKGKWSWPDNGNLNNQIDITQPLEFNNCNAITFPYRIPKYGFLKQLVAEPSNPINANKALYISLSSDLGGDGGAGNGVAWWKIVILLQVPDYAGTNPNVSIAGKTEDNEGTESCLPDAFIFDNPSASKDLTFTLDEPITISPII